MSENFELFAYLNVGNPMVLWEIAIGRHRSVCDRSEANSHSISLWQYGLFRQYIRHGMSPKIANEFRLEAIRQKHYPSCVSRLTGLYFFETRADAEDAIDKWNLAQSKKQFISKINCYAATLSRHDSEWITHYLGKQSKNDEWMHSYWSGEVYGSLPLVEVIASGVGHIEDTLIRKYCYESAMEKYPLSSVMLSLGQWH